MGLFSRRFQPSIFRLLRQADAGACAAIHAASFAHPWSPGEFGALIADPAVHPLPPADPATRALRGFSLARAAADEAEILTIAVAAPMRRRGVGRALLTRQCAALADSGVRALFLEVEEGNGAAIALYRRLGFADVGARPGYYRRAGAAPGAALVMKKALA